RGHYEFLILGVGTTADAAIEGILRVRPDADILVISREAQLPRMDVYAGRRPLGADLEGTYNEWRRHVATRLEDAPGGGSASHLHPLTLLLARDDYHLDLEARQLVLGGERFSFDKALVATAGRPRDLYVLENSELGASWKADRINPLNDLGDFETLDTLFLDEPTVRRVTVIGGGFLGTEMALALAKRAQGVGGTVVQAFAEKYPLEHYLPRYLCQHLSEKMRAQGVEYCNERLITSIVDDELSEGLKLNLIGEARSEERTDYVVLASTHVDPQTQCAAGTLGLEVDPRTGGVVVGATLEAAAGVYAAGGAACYYDAALGRRRRLDRFDHSINSGIVNPGPLRRGRRQDANPFPGGQKLYTHQPAFKTHLPAIGVEVQVIGDIHSSMQTIGLWVDQDCEKKASAEYQRGIVYYLEGHQVAGVLLWNAPDLLDRARTLLRSHGAGGQRAGGKEEGRGPAQDAASVRHPDAKNLNRQLPLAPHAWLRVMETDPA
ncbi:unnamed protein product, partial [Heterosigma akashiwo]